VPAAVPVDPPLDEPPLELPLLDEPPLELPLLDEPPLDEPLLDEPLLELPPDVPPPPPQLARIQAPSSNTVIRAMRPRDGATRIERARRCTAKGSSIPPVVQGLKTLAVAAVVLIVTVSVAALPLTVTVAAEKVQAAPAGSPEQVNETLASNPPLGVSVKVVVAACPGATVAAELDAERVNVGLAATAG